VSELDSAQSQNLAELNARLWAWLEQVYHATPHSALAGLTPRQRWHQDLAVIRPLGPFAERLDALFYHRYTRRVRKDATVSIHGQRFEVAFELAGRQVVVVVDAHREQVLGVENEQGQSLGPATPLDVHANTHRHRVRPLPPTTEASDHTPQFNAVELAYRRYGAALTDPQEDDQ
jgi:hypothetical protein